MGEAEAAGRADGEGDGGWVWECGVPGLRRGLLWSEDPRCFVWRGSARWDFMGLFMFMGWEYFTLRQLETILQCTLDTFS